MATKYLDSNGLAYFWEKIKAYGNAHWGGGGGASVLDYYPVGSYYETSDTSFDPNTAWGGKWSLETEGQVHVSSGSNYAVSGALTDTTDGGSEYIQAHTHDFTQPTVNGGACTITSSGGHSHNYSYANQASFKSAGTSSTHYSLHNYSTKAVSGDGSHTHSVPNHTHSVSGGTVGAVSGATTGNAGNMPPYIVVNRWHRTA